MKKALNLISNFYKNTYGSLLRHPLYNRKCSYTNLSQMKQLKLMRDLRLWVIENAPHSNNISKYSTEITHLTSLLNRFMFHSKLFLKFKDNFLLSLDYY